MKVAVLSDIHSNHIALEACLNYVEKENIDSIILLGDFVSDCPNPQVTLNVIRQLYDRYHVYAIRGNREEYFIKHADGFEDHWVYEVNTGSLLYTYENLKKEDIDWFRSLDNHSIVTIEGTDPIVLMHGSISNSRELLYKEADNTKELLDSIPYRYVLCGHTHRQFAYEYNQKRLINPGSVGVAIGCKKSAHMATMEWRDGAWNVKFHTIPYCYEKLQEEFEKSEMKEKANLWMQCIMKSIEEGVNYAPLCVKRAYDLAKKQTGKSDWVNIPVQYWKEAAIQMKILKEKG